MKTILVLFITYIILSAASCEKAENQPLNKLYYVNPPVISFQLNLVNDTIMEVPVIIIGNTAKRFIVSFINDVDGFPRIFTPEQNSLPIIMSDELGNQWDISGIAVSGPDTGKRLKSTTSFMGYWFAWGAFFPGIEIYNDDQIHNPLERVYTTGEWLIPVNEVMNGGPGKDGIPSLELPDFVSAESAEYMDPEDLILGIVMNNEVRAYPIKILDWHEIINDSISGVHYSITYCPLTGTGIGWSQEQNGIRSTFGVSGLLYNSNLIPYDRETDSYWSQIRLDCVQGSRKGENIKTIQLIETTWENWKNMYPNTKVVAVNTNFDRQYNQYPYGDYRSINTTYFPANPVDTRLHSKEVVHGIVLNDHAKAYRFKDFGN